MATYKSKSLNGFFWGDWRAIEDELEAGEGWAKIITPSKTLFLIAFEDILSICLTFSDGGN